MPRTASAGSQAVTQSDARNDGPGGGGPGGPAAAAAVRLPALAPSAAVPSPSAGLNVAASPSVPAAALAAEPVVIAPSSASIAPVAVPSPAATAVAARVSAAAVGTVRAAPSRYSRSSGPGSPAESTAGWVVLAAVRRLGRPQEESAAVAATVATGQTLTASATSADPIATFFFNTTPTQSSTQSAQSPTGVITGAIVVNDPDSDVFTYTVTTGPAYGTAQVDATGQFTYTPNPDSAHTGLTDSFTVTVSDAASGFHIHGLCGLINLLTFGLLGDSGHTSARAVTVTVTPINNDPSGTATVGDPDDSTGVVSGQIDAVDPDGDPLTYTGSTTTAKGTVVVDADGGFTYTPTAEARHAAAALTATAADKADGFTVSVADSYGGSTDVLVAVAISPTNTAPTAWSTVGTPDSSSGVVRGSIDASDADGDAVAYSGPATTEPAAMTVPSPISAPSSTTVPAPIQTSLPIRIPPRDG